MKLAGKHYGHKSVCFEDMYTFKTKVNVIGLSVFFCSTIVDIFSLTHKEKEVLPDGTNPMLFAESSCVYMSMFLTSSPFLFLAKVPFLAYM